MLFARLDVLCWTETENKELLLCFLVMKENGMDIYTFTAYVISSMFSKVWIWLN